MPTLHLVFTPHTAGSALADSLRVARAGDTVLLLQDGVYAAATDHPLLAVAADRRITLVAREADVIARGLRGRLRAPVTTVDDDGFVALSERCVRSASWF